MLVGTLSIADLLCERGLEVDASNRRRAEYSSDASNYRVLPLAVVYPRNTDEVAEIVAVAADTGTPVTVRGGGTSTAGNAIGPGIVMETSRHLSGIGPIDPASATAVVEPGAVLSDLQRAAGAHGLRFGPDPSTSDRCTIGGMIGNNACGARTLRFGRTADNVESLTLVTGTGATVQAGAGTLPPELEGLSARNLAVLRTEFGGFLRQISGYSLEHLLPEQGRHLARALVGTEGTCGIVTEATVRLVPVPRDPLLVVLGYQDMIAAADAVGRLLPLQPVAIEGMDSRLVNAVRALRGADAVPDLPPGRGWLFVEVDDLSGCRFDAAHAVSAAGGALGHRVVGGFDAKALWRVRADGVGLAGRTVSGRQAWPGLEDAAVPPDRLGAYLRDFAALLDTFGMEGSPYGHFGDGCIHVRLDIPLEHDGRLLDGFMRAAAELIASHGGSLSGEHGDGRARSELLRTMYSPEALHLMSAFKHHFDPAGVLNPGIVVEPAPLAESLRRPAARATPLALGFTFPHDDGDLTMAAHRCVGVGRCRTDSSSGGFMCPSYRATADEKDSTRGRARVLQEVINGTFIHGWDSSELAESLDLCLSCKACSVDCPAGVDMAGMKSEVLHRRYQRRLRPVSHYSLGWLPLWARLATRLSAPINALLSVRPLERLVLWAGGMDTRRNIPRFARRRFSAGRSMALQRTATERVLLWADTFTDHFSPEVAAAAVRVLEAAGYQVQLPAPVCCGLTWITTGQLNGAKRRLRALLSEFHPLAEAGVPIVGLDPSCLAVLRGDLESLLSDDPRSATVAAASVTLAELLQRTPGWDGPDLLGQRILVQPHCHHHSVLGFATDRRLLESLGAQVDELAGCCGLAGNFGMERGHYDFSVAVAETSLLPALRSAEEGTVLLADGFSCRTQAAQIGGWSAMHLAQLLADEVPKTEPPKTPGCAAPPLK